MLDPLSEEMAPRAMVGYDIAWDLERPDTDGRGDADGCGYQFEFSGTAVGRNAFGPVEVDWHYWGLKCPDSEEWRLWEEFNQVMGDSPTRARQVATPLGRNSSSSTSTVSCLAGRGPASA